MSLGGLAVILLVVLAPQAPEPATLRGVVVDPVGAPVTGARISLGEAGGAVDVDVAGRFTIGVPRGTTIEVRTTAPGFAARDEVVRVPPSGDPPDLRITLAPRAVGETVVVTATRGAGPAEVAAPVSVLTGTDIQLAASPVIDDALRAVPGFSLFRRTSSRTANPTAQGAALRGLGASGASRALVIADGALLNDPFGGWVYWNRVPQAAIERVEVARGGLSDLYGADALGGVVQVLTRAPRTGALLMAGADSLSTARASLAASAAAGGWSGSLAAEAVRTDGAYVLADEDRGRVDTKAGAAPRTLQARVARQWPGAWRVRAGGDVFAEDRENGTRLQVNDTTLRVLRLDAAGPLAGGLVEVSALAGDQVYEQAFSAVAAGRAAETLTVRQRVPANQHAYTASWTREAGSVRVLAGAEVRDVDAVNREQAFFADGRLRGVTVTPAFARTSGIYGSLRTSIGRATVVGGVRGDRWQPSRGDGHRREDALSPRIAASFALTPSVQLRAGVSRSFRAPTLNELHRGFRVGSVETQPNPDLRPERLTTADGGALVASSRWSLLVTGFLGDLDAAVTNVTVRATPALITRRRENAGRVRANGLEAEGEWRVRRSLTTFGSLTLTRSRYHDTPGLTGNRVPQVPIWQTALGARWLAPRRTTLQAQVRASGEQYEDDRNTLALARAVTVDVTATHAIGRRVGIFAAVENLFDREVATGRTPLTTIGIPRTLQLGVRVWAP